MTLSFTVLAWSDASLFSQVGQEDRLCLLLIVDDLALLAFHLLARVQLSVLEAIHYLRRWHIVLLHAKKGKPKLAPLPVDRYDDSTLQLRSVSRSFS